MEPEGYLTAEVGYIKSPSGCPFLVSTLTPDLGAVRVRGEDGAGERD
jgi:hypothetical protein